MNVSELTELETKWKQRASEREQIHDHVFRLSRFSDFIEKPKGCCLFSQRCPKCDTKLIKRRISQGNPLDSEAHYIYYTCPCGYEYVY